MQYDRLAEAAEKHFPAWRKAVEDARLFVLDIRDRAESDTSRLAKDTLRNWEPDATVIENFRMPFNTVAIECKACCVLQTVDAASRTFNALVASDGSSETIIGECQLTAFPDEASLHDASRIGRSVKIENLRVWAMRRGRVQESMFSMNELYRKRDGSKLHRDVFVVGSSLVVGGSVVHGRAAIQAAESLMPQLQADVDISRAAVAHLEFAGAVWMALAICEPSTFIVEHTHVDFVPREPKTGKVVRSPYRPHYIVLTPGEIRRRFIRDDDGEAIPSGMTRRPHERRGHYRKLTSEKYVAKRNHVIWIKPCWVGKTEGVVGKNRYVVRLDL